MSEWLEMVEKIRSRKKLVHIALVGKYVKLHDAYLSVMEALRHAGYDHSAKVEIDWVDSENLTEENMACPAGEHRRHHHPRRVWQPGH